MASRPCHVTSRPATLLAHLASFAIAPGLPLPENENQIAGGHKPQILADWLRMLTWTSKLSTLHRALLQKCKISG